MTDDRLHVEAAGVPPERPSAWFIGLAAVGVVGLLAVLGSGGFSQPEEQDAIDATVPLTIADPAPVEETTVVTESPSIDVVPHGNRPNVREVTEEIVSDLTDTVPWTAVLLPSTVTDIVAVGEIGDGVGIVGGVRRADGAIGDAVFVVWNGQWSAPVPLTREHEIVDAATFGTAGVVVATFDGIGPTVGETSILWSRDGIEFTREIVSAGPPDRSVVRMRHLALWVSDLWAFGTESTSGWATVIDQLDEPLRQLIASGDVVATVDGSDAVFYLNRTIPIERIPLDEFGTTAGAVESGVGGINRAWFGDLATGTIGPVPDPFDGFFVMTANVSAAVTVSRMGDSYQSWSVFGQTWTSQEIGGVDGYLLGSIAPMVVSVDSDDPDVRLTDGEDEYVIRFDLDALPLGIPYPNIAQGLVLPILSRQGSVHPVDTSVSIGTMELIFSVNGGAQVAQFPQTFGSLGGGDSWSLELSGDRLVLFDTEGTYWGDLQINDIELPVYRPIARQVGVIVSGRDGFDFQWLISDDPEVSTTGPVQAVALDGEAYVVLGGGWTEDGRGTTPTLWIGRLTEQP